LLVERTRKVKQMMHSGFVHVVCEREYGAEDVILTGLFYRHGRDVVMRRPPERRVPGGCRMRSTHRT
jgi:hypothetical protein